MLDTILGFKRKMGTVYVKDRRFPVTWVEVKPCVVTQIKNADKDGYLAVQIGIGSRTSKNLNKPLQSHLKNILKDNKAPRFIREIRIKEENGLKAGELIKLSDVLKKGDIVTVTGTSKGKGFAGVVKRWKFAGGPKTHGQSDRERAPGSIGNRTTPGRVFKGKRMAGRMGSDRVTVKNLNVIDIDEMNSLVAITGAVPGVTGGLVVVRKTGEGKIAVESMSEDKIEKEEEAQEEISSSPSVIKEEENLEKKDEETKNSPPHEATEGEAK